MTLLYQHSTCLMGLPPGMAIFIGNIRIDEMFFFFAFFWLYSLFRQIHTPMFFGSKRLPGFQWSQKPAGRDMVSQ